MVSTEAAVHVMCLWWRSVFGRRKLWDGRSAGPRAYQMPLHNGRPVRRVYVYCVSRSLEIMETCSR